jgi:methyl-galactoside transport system ATP-binding protein
MLHQELNLIPYRSVIENIWLGRYPTKGIGPLRLVDGAKMKMDTHGPFQEPQ